MGRRGMDERSAHGKELVGRKPLTLSRTIHINLLALEMDI